MRFSSPISSFSRWRHSRGFGVHSPFAYTFITEVLAQRLHYYGYADISNDSRLRLLFRIIAKLQPARVRILSSQPRLIVMAVRRAYSGAKMTAQDPEFIVADDLDVKLQQYFGQIDAGANAVILNASETTRKELKETLRHGMVFDNGHGTIVVITKHGLPRQDFDVKF